MVSEVLLRPQIIYSAGVWEVYGIGDKLKWMVCAMLCYT